MTAVLLTWNPKNWDWKELPALIVGLANGRLEDQRWSCGNTRAIEVGTRVFLLRQGVEPKGIVASGWTTRGPFVDTHWDADRAAKGDSANYIEFRADELLDASKTDPLDVRGFSSDPLTRVNWNTQVSGIRLDEDAAFALEKAWARHRGSTVSQTVIGDPELSAFEGEIRIRVIKHRVREQALRDSKLKVARASSADGHLRCEVPGCGFDFERVYGEVGSGFAHVHHRTPLADVDGQTETRLQDLAVVCANCHAMIHRGGGCRPLEGLVVARESQ